jgi:hypothetical protein
MSEVSRPRSSMWGRHTYRPVGNKAIRHKPISIIEPPPKWARHVDEDSTPCCECGWPLSAVTGSPVFAGSERGDKRFKHFLCPSLRERRALRQAALVQS